MKIYHDAQFNGIVIEGVRNIFPARSLVLDALVGGYWIRAKGTDRVISGPLDLSNIQDADGNIAQSPVAHIEDMFSRDREGGHIEFAALPALP